MFFKSSANITFKNSSMKTLDPREILQKKYDSKMSYSFWISAAIVQGEHDLAFRFLSCNADRKGIKWILF